MIGGSRHYLLLVTAVQVERGTSPRCIPSIISAWHNAVGSGAFLKGTLSLPVPRDNDLPEDPISCC